MSVGPVQRDGATAEFFDGTAEGRFLIRRCPASHYSEPAVKQCTACGSTELGWAEAAGDATLVSWAILPAGTVLVIAELDEGPWWWSQLDAADPAELSVGDRLRISFRRADDEHEAVPVFELAR
jgi:uncharacterized OB-fold protein